MKVAIATVALLVLALGWSSEAVQVEENGMFFSLEAVRRLQELASSNYPTGQQNPRFRTSGLAFSAFHSLCVDPRLPKEFLSLCEQKGASASLARLALVPMDVCEVCAFAACAGC